MNKQELIERIEGLKNIFGNKCEYVKIDFVIELASELDELEAGHADEAPRYVKNILARLRELPLHDREVWLKTIMGEFEQDFSRAKWREGYEQGKFDGAVEREKPVVKQFVADWYEKNKDEFELNLWLYLTEFDEENIDMSERFGIWLGDEDNNPIQTLVNMHQFGYEVEEEKQYEVLLCNGQSLKTVYRQGGDRLDFEKVYGDLESFTRKQLEDAGLSWVFDCEGIEVREVEE